jgi:hypothetical protein
MRELDRALGDIAALRDQIARSSSFQGFGPVVLAATGLLALAAAATQSLWLPAAASHTTQFLVLWLSVAAAAVTAIGTDAVARSRRAHGSMSLSMLKITAEHFCPSIVAGGCLTLVLLRSAPDAAWMLPGLWQIVFCLGAFAVARILPRPMFIVGVWYLVCGLTCLQFGQASPLSGWTMGLPFGVGQLLVAGILIRHRHQAEA